MSMNCPYDDTECLIKKVRFEDFCRRVKEASQQRSNQIFYEPAADECPSIPEECVRYQRYLNIVNKLKANGQQR